MGSVIREKGSGHQRRYEVLALAKDHYLVRSLFSALGVPDVFFWRIEACEELTRIEWQKALPLVEFDPATDEEIQNPDLVQEELWMTDKMP
jgi:hypothetical protein